MKYFKIIRNTFKNYIKHAQNLEEFEKVFNDKLVNVEVAKGRLEELKRDIEIEKNTTYKLKEKPMNEIEELEQIVKDALSKIEEIKEQDNDIDWRIANEYSLDDDFDLIKGGQHSIFFSDLRVFNIFEEKEHAELWARKINANLKLWHIAQELNDGWEPTNPVWFFYIDRDLNARASSDYSGPLTYFQDIEKTEKAKILMGDMLKDLYIEIY